MSPSAVNALEQRPDKPSVVPGPYLLFLGDTTEPGYAKTALGLRDWAPERCIGEIVLPGATVSAGLPRLTPAEAHARGARAMLIGVASPGGLIPPAWLPLLVDALDAGLDLVAGMHVRLADLDELSAVASRRGRRLIDAVVSDFVAGAAEMLSPDAAPGHVDVIEGQGSLFHPAYAAVSLGLLHGSQPDAFIVCHQPGRTHVLGYPQFALPTIEAVIAHTIALGSLTSPTIRCAGVSLNTGAIDAGDVARLITGESARLGLVVADPMRGGAAFEALLDACLE